MIVAVPVNALVTMSTLLTATPAPMPTLASDALSPLASALTSVSPQALTVTTPPELMVTPVPSHPRTVDVTTLMATAPAMDTEAPPPSSLAALGVDDVPVVLPVSSFWVVLAEPRLSSAFLLTSLPPPSLPSDLDAPWAAASATVLTSAVPVATKETAPPAAMLRAVPESTRASMTARARETPMPAELPTVVSPLAVVVAFTVWLAVALMAPVALRPEALAPNEAVVVTVARVMATAGVMLTDPPAEPDSALVVMLWVFVAAMVSEPAPVSGGPRVGVRTWSTPALTMSVTRLSPSPAPMPTVPEPDWLALPFDVELELDPAVKDTAPALMMTTPGSGDAGGSGAGLFPSALRVATVVASTILIAKAPAIPRLPLLPDAPALASARNSYVVSAPPAPIGRIWAARTRPPAVSAAPIPTEASLRRMTLLTARAAPIVTELPLLAEPSATALASVLFRVLKDTGPVAMTTMAGAMIAVVVEVTRFRAMAAATLTVAPSSFLAAGVLASLAPVPLAVLDLSLAKPSCSSPFSFVSLLVVSLPPVLAPPLAPAEVAVAVVLVVEVPSAAIVIDPLVVTLR